MKRRSFIGGMIGTVAGLLGLEKVKVAAEEKKLPEYPSNCSYELIHVSERFRVITNNHHYRCLVCNCDSRCDLSMDDVCSGFRCWIINQGAKEVVIKNVSGQSFCLLPWQSVMLTSEGKDSYSLRG